MRNRKFQNEDLDNIGRSLLRAGMVRGDEIERIVSRPELFASIRSRIDAENDEGRSTRVVRFSGLRIAASAGLAAIVIAVLAFAVFIGNDPQPDMAYVVEPPEEVVEETLPQQPVAEPDPPAPAENTRPQRTQQPPVSVTAKAFRRKETRRPAERQKPQKPVDLGEFYALANFRSTTDAALDAQVIRVEVPRASLVAMGVNLPLENGTENIKTDLLVGPDGVTRAIRLVE